MSTVFRPTVPIGQGEEAGPFSGTGNIDDMGWYEGNSGPSGARRTHPVGQKQPNQFGLYDMHGNVYEWCEGVYDETFYTRDVPSFDRLSTLGSGNRVNRGGCFDLNAMLCRSAARDG